MLQDTSVVGYECCEIDMGLTWAPRKHSTPVRGVSKVSIETPFELSVVSNSFSAVRAR